MNLLAQIETLAQPLRAATFLEAAAFILTLDKPVLIETGCYRGDPGDGQSTVILALLAQATSGQFFSHELHWVNIDIAAKRLPEQGLEATFLAGDSVETLKLLPGPISFAYLDSYDFEEHKADDAQLHQLKEAEILLPKMAPESGFLLDDCDLPLGGKGRLSAPLLLDHGYIEVATRYQRMFLRQ